MDAKGLATGVRPPDTSERKRRRQEESIMQRKVVQWFDLSCKARWKLDSRVLFSVPNEGWRGPATAAIMKAGGLRSGVPDVFLAVYANEAHPIQPKHYYGLFLEFKVPTGRVMPKQEAYHKILREQGYRVEVVRSYDQAVEVISGYLDAK